MANDWHRFVVRCQRLLNSDDGKFCSLARGELGNALADVPDGAACPDPELFTAFVGLARAWSRRADAVPRERIGCCARMMADELAGIPGEARREIERGRGLGAARFVAGLD